MSEHTQKIKSQSKKQKKSDESHPKDSFIHFIALFDRWRVVKWNKVLNNSKWDNKRAFGNSVDSWFNSISFKSLLLMLNVSPKNTENL